MARFREHLSGSAFAAMPARGVELLQQAEVLLNSGQSENAVNVLESAVECKGGEDDKYGVSRAARYTLALLNLCSDRFEVNGRAKTQADAHLRKLGFRYRLARQAFIGGSQPGKNAAPPVQLLHPPRGMLQVVDSAIPAGWVNHLRNAFAPTSTFWPEHRYDDPATGYFSYHFPVSGPTARPPCHSVEELIAKHIWPTVRRCW